MAYATRVEALRRRFGQETDTSIALQELAGLRRGKNQSAKELADSARWLASRAYHSNDYASQEKAALHAFQTAVGEDLQLKCTERSCRTLEMAVETVEIQERYTKKAVRALKQEESDMALHLKAMGEILEALMGEIKDDREQRKQWAARRESGRRHGVSLVPSKGPFRERMPDQHGRTLGKRTVAAVAIDAGPQEGAATEESVTIGNGLYLPGRIGGNGVSFLVDTGSGVSILAARTWRKWGRTEDELTRYWGLLCSVEGRALECLGKARLTVTLGTRVVEWGFIVAEIGDDEGILGNDFAVAHELTVQPCEGAVYLPDLAWMGRGQIGERLPCTIRVVTEVRAVTEETLAVRAVGPATPAPHTVSQVRVIVPTPRARGTVMVDQGPGPLGLCPVRGIVEVEQDSNIWLANTGSQPIQIDKDEVVAMAECVLAEPGASAGSDRDVGDEVNGLVERASPHLTSEECWQLQTTMAARKHLFAKGKGDLGRTDIVQHQIHTGDQPAIKQRVRRYPAVRREEERQLVEDMLAIGIIQESNSAWSSPTVLVKIKDGTKRFCIDYRRLNQAKKVDAYPLPHIEDSLNTLGGARFFCSLDLASGYWQVEMDAAD